MSWSRWAPDRSASCVATLILGLVMLSGCGVALSESSNGTELFKTMWLTSGEKAELCDRRGSAWVCPSSQSVTVNVGVTDGYPVPVKVACFYEDPDTVTEDQEKLTFHERATPVGETVLDAVEGAKPADFSTKKGDTKPKDFLRFTFPAPPAGSYLLVCLTPAAPDNAIALTFKVRP